MQLARRTADNVFIPFTIGGGIRSREDAQAVLDAGADKVSVNSAAVARPGADVGAGGHVRRAMRGAGDRREAAYRRASDGFEVFVNGGRVATGSDAVEWAREGAERGAGEILLTSMDRDGTEDGYDIELTRAVADAVDMPVIASGGAGRLEHLSEAISPRRRRRRAVRVDLPLRDVPRAGGQGAPARGRASRCRPCVKDVAAPSRAVPPQAGFDSGRAR